MPFKGSLKASKAPWGQRFGREIRLFRYLAKAAPALHFWLRILTILFKFLLLLIELL